ncbi:MAG: sulfotransferase domain-containing protein [Phycisphaerae bacterium]
MIKAFRQHIKNQRTESFIVSFPKTGRTWLRVMIGRILVEDYGVAEDKMLSTYKATRGAGVGPCIFSHGGPYHLLDDGPFDLMDIPPRVFEGKRILFLIRDIRDTLVSFYFQQHKREKVYEGDMSSFLRDKRYGAQKIVKFYTMWFQKRASLAQFEMIRYESLRSDPVQGLTGVVQFLQFQRSSVESVQRAVDFASFDNMRQMEQKGQFTKKMMRPGDPADKESFKVRKGKVGGYTEYLSAEDLDYIQQVIAEQGDPACDWYLYQSA